MLYNVGYYIDKRLIESYVYCHKYLKMYCVFILKNSLQTNNKYFTIFSHNMLLGGWSMLGEH